MPIQEIPYGEKMITFKVRFFTDGLTNKKMAWETGAVTVVTNRSRGIRNEPKSHEFFNNLDEIETAIKKVLKKNGISIVRKDKQTKQIVLVDLD